MAFYHCVFDEKISVTDPVSGEIWPRQIMCNTRPVNRHCDKCGWNPVVESARKKQLRESEQK